MNKPKVLIIEDEVQMRRLLEITLQSNDYATVEATTGKEGLVAAASHPPELILLDIGLPDESGHSILVKLRKWYNGPIIILSVQDSEIDIVSALDSGATDYLVKPFRTGELLARIRSALRKQQSSSTATLRFGDIEIDLAMRSVKKNGETVKLTSTEYNLFTLLAKNEGRVLTHQYLLKQVWGPAYVEHSQYLRVFIAQIRKKTETDPNKPQHILTESAVGYRFVNKE